MAFGGLMLENRNGSVNMYIPSVVRVGSYSFYGDIFPHMVISFSINYWQLLPPIPIMVVCVCYWRGKLIMEIWRVIRELVCALNARRKASHKKQHMKSFVLGLAIYHMIWGKSRNIHISYSTPPLGLVHKFYSATEFPLHYFIPIDQGENACWTIR